MSAPAPPSWEKPVSVSDRWRAIPRRYQVVWVILAAAVLFEIASSLLSGLASGGNGASGPSSTYDSSQTGTQAFAQLLADRGHHVVRQTVPLSRAELGPGATLFVLDPVSWSSSDTQALMKALHLGHKVVLGGRPPQSGLLAKLLGGGPAPLWQSAAAGAVTPVGSSPGTTGLSVVLAPGGGTYRAGSGTGTRPLLAGPEGALALASARFPLVLLASSSPLQDQTIADADNAAFGLDLAGPGRRTVVFDEYDHGFGHPGSGLAGLPARWRWGLGMALVSAAISILSAARRFGPPALQERSFIPARVEYVDAMATALSARPAAQLAEAVSPLVEHAQRLLVARAGLAPGSRLDDAVEILAHDPLVGDAASSLARAASARPSTPDGIVALGRALARFEREAVGSDR